MTKQVESGAADVTAHAGKMSSIRARIAILAALPVLALLLAGTTFWFGQRAVLKASDQSLKYAALVETATEIKTNALTMRAVVESFRVDPMPRARDDFQKAMESNEQLVARMRASFDADMNGVLNDFARHNAPLAENFTSLYMAQEKLGMAGDQGIRRQLAENGRELDLVFNEVRDNSDLTLSELPRTKDALRLSEKDYLLIRSHQRATDFTANMQRFREALKAANISNSRRAELVEAGEAYNKTFDEARAAHLAISSALNRLVMDMTRLPKTADNVVAQARIGQAEAVAAGERAREATLLVSLGVIALTILASVIISARIGGSISRPLGRIAEALNKIGRGETDVDISDLRGNGEIGRMAHAVSALRDTVIEREQLAIHQKDTTRQETHRAQQLQKLIRDFEQRAAATVGGVRGAVDKLHQASSGLVSSSSLVTGEARSASMAANGASQNVTAVAGAAEQLSMSIQEVASRAENSNSVAHRAVAEAQSTVTTMDTLAQAAGRIGEVITLIQAIAAQTNLLALNATIEAARAGDAGKGFAVVAQEVKSLASQTANATQEIARQISAIQDNSAEATKAIERVNAIIAEMSGITSAVAAAVEEQSGAVRAIAANVAQASADSQTGASAMDSVEGAANSARRTAEDVAELAGTLQREAETMDTAVRTFLQGVRAA